MSVYGDMKGTGAGKEICISNGRLPESWTYAASNPENIGGENQINIFRWISLMSYVEISLVASCA